MPLHVLAIRAEANTGPQGRLVVQEAIVSAGDRRAQAMMALGRIFTIDGVMHLVLEADPVYGQCRVSRRRRSTTETVTLPLDRVIGYLSVLPGSQTLEK